MERLTLEEAIKYIKEVVQKNRKNKEKNTIVIPNSFISSTDCAEKYEQVAKWLEELKSYKDIGTPKELKELKENGAFTGLELAKLAIMQKELKEYKDLEEQGLLVRFPYNNGTLYSVNYSNKTIAENTIIEIAINGHSKRFSCLDDNLRERKFYDYMIGENVFLTREEAEKKLEEMKKNG